MTELTAIVGYSAAAIGTCLMLPQVYKTFRTKSVEDVSWGMLILYFLNCALWLVYGFLIDSNPLLLTNATALLISCIQMFLTYRYSSTQNVALAPKA